MNWVHSILILVAAFIAIFLESAFGGFRHFLGAQIDLLPALMVYASLSSGFGMVILLAVLGGLCFDSISANPLGVSILPLLLVGFLIYMRRGLILREQTFAQFCLGLGASAITPMLTLLLLLSTRQTPLIGWGSIWQWVVMAVGGAVFTPICFRIFDGLNRALSYSPVTETSFRPDREIRRSRK
ncbi:rod shape-determining protein MreD [Pedosphaera parvula]|uniref:Rod shape-determining protein MreD n=1 Tax=Pedosphaera parvula (strain Ellin514) TaxID=320771 RepID=B9XG15_PEDPL|nr:rod shape-determining protein MreD [Pedosphaera parvula]EEF61177.1 rod shape-determining protein MreD [Pedosphaera parvula Ellin514]